MFNSWKICTRVGHGRRWRQNVTSGFIDEKRWWNASFLITHRYTDERWIGCAIANLAGKKTEVCAKYKGRSSLATINSSKAVIFCDKMTIKIRWQRRKNCWQTYNKNKAWKRGKLKLAYAGLISVELAESKSEQHCRHCMSLPLVH